MRARLLHYTSEKLGLKVKENKITFEKYLEIKPKQGHMIIVSSLDREPEWIYNLYRRRNSIEKRFRTIFSILEADETYLRDEDKLRGHLFIAFLSLKILSRLEARIRDAGLLNSISIEDVILEYSRAYAVSYQGGKIDYEVHAKVEDLNSN